MILIVIVYELLVVGEPTLIGWVTQLAPQFGFGFAGYALELLDSSRRFLSLGPSTHGQSGWMIRRLESPDFGTAEDTTCLNVLHTSADQH